MKRAFQAATAFSLLLVLGSGCISAHAQNTIIDAPGVHISSGPDGASIIAPGVNIQAPQNPNAYAPPPVPTMPQQVIMPPQQVIMNAAPTSSSAHSSYVNAELPNMDFSHQDLSGAQFTNATLSGSNFSGSNLAGADFSNADLTNTDLTNARLTNATLTNAKLSGANLTNADFSGADLTNASLDHALAIGTNFKGANLTNVNMSLLSRQPVAPAVLVNAQAISSALRIDPAHPHAQHKIDLTVNFDFNSDKLTSDGVRQVNEIASALKDPSLQRSHIIVEGHTDNVGSDVYNQNLSSRRASRVLHTLVDQYGVSVEQLSAQGFGKTRPIASNDNDLGRAKNRRVTLVNLGE